MCSASPPKAPPSPSSPADPGAPLAPMVSPEDSKKSATANGGEALANRKGASSLRIDLSTPAQSTGLGIPT